MTKRNRNKTNKRAKTWCAIFDDGSCFAHKTRDGARSTKVYYSNVRVSKFIELKKDDVVFTKSRKLKDELVAKVYNHWRDSDYMSHLDALNDLYDLIVRNGER